MGSWPGWESPPSPVFSASAKKECHWAEVRGRETAAGRHACLLTPGCVSGTPPLGVTLYSNRKTHVPVGTRTASA